MPLSVVIHLMALENGSLPADSGRALNALFLNWVREASPHLSAQLHAGSELRPYTVSDLLGIARIEHGFKLVRSGEPAWMRVTSLKDETLSGLLKDSILPMLAGKVFSVGRTSFRITALSTRAADHPWAGEISYQALLETHLFDPTQPDPSVHLEFSSPTTFRTQGKNSPLPLPEHLLDSWLARWNAASPVQLPLEARSFAAQYLALSEYRLQTAVVHTGKTTQVGFTGRCTLRLLSEDPYWLRMLHLLSNYSFYCATGAKTTIGLGQTRPLAGRETE